MKVGEGPALRLLRAEPAPLALALEVVDPELVQEVWLEEYLVSLQSRGFSGTTLEGLSGSLDRLLGRCPVFVWEVTAEVVDSLLVELTASGVATSTRRSQLGDLVGFHRFVRARKGAEVEARFGVSMVDPVDEFNAIVHVSDEGGARRVPPSADRLDGFFEVLRERVETARKYAPAARDYALFRVLYWTGLRSAEAVAVDVGDLHWDRGPFGKIHVRFGKGARTSGPRPRWVPMLDATPDVLRWYVEDVRPLFSPDGDALWVVQHGGRMTGSTLQNELARMLDIEGGDRFSPHDLRRACATHNYERGVDLVAIQQMLGHWHIGTTMRYVMPSATFIEDAYRRAISDTLDYLANTSDNPDQEED